MKDFKNWPFVVSIDYLLNPSIMPWLEQYVGYRGEHWAVSYTAQSINFYFQSAFDAAYFKLKWKNFND